MRKVLVLFWLATVVSGALTVAVAQDDPVAQQAPHAFSIGLLAGYNAVAMLVYDVDWKSVSDRLVDVDVNDDSYIDPGPLAGVALTYLPALRHISFGITAEFFYQHTQGKLKGNVGDNPQDVTGYEFDLSAHFTQIDFLGTFFFTRKPFQPYLQIGLGALRSDIEIDDDRQTAYGASGIVAWGAQYRFASWFAFGGQVRMQDQFGLVYRFEPDDVTLVTIEAQYIPLSLLLHTTFLF